MRDDARHFLIESLRQHLLPAFEARGFEVIPLTEEEANSREFRTAFPFGRLRRVSSRGFELVEIQLDKHGHAAFRLNFGVAPNGGIDHELGHVAQDKIWVHYLNSYFQAYSLPLFRRWFSVRRWFGPSATQADYESLVSDNLGLVQEVEDAMRNGKRGRHIRLVEM